MELPFVGLTRAHVALDEDARMRKDADGTPIRMSTRASYPEFMSWTGGCLADVAHADR